MSIIRVGSSAPYAAGWDHIFGGAKAGAKKTVAKRTAKKTSKKASKAKATKKKPARAKK